MAAGPPSPFLRRVTWICHHWRHQKMSAAAGCPSPTTCRILSHGIRTTQHVWQPTWLFQRGQKKHNKDALVDNGPITMFDEEEATVDFSNHLHPQVAAATITQGDQAEEGAQPAQPPLPPMGGGVNWGGLPQGNRSILASDQPFSALVTQCTAWQ